MAHDRFGLFTSKTAMALIRYGDDVVVAVVDRSKGPGDASEHIGDVGKGIPMMGSMKDTLSLDPDAVVFGWAPEGGALPEHDREELLMALRAGVDVVSGLHDFLGDNPEFVKAAEDGGATVTDLRRPPSRKRLLTGEVASKVAPVVLVTGTDCSTGKMTVAIEMVLEARERGMDAAFIATGQSGMLIGCDAGSPIDAIVGDFMAGEVEAMVLQVDRRGPDLILVEGQGALSHPAYGAVSLAIHQGCYPDALVMCHDPSRTHYKAFLDMDHRPFIPHLGGEVAMAERVLLNTSMGEVAAVALVTTDMDPREETAVKEEVMETMDLVAADVMKDGPGPLLDAVLEYLETKGDRTG
jgi:uncharacterized NAD-dependent epimerase/dehydratase family protein